MSLFGKLYGNRNKNEILRIIRVIGGFLIIIFGLPGHLSDFKEWQNWMDIVNVPPLQLGVLLIGGALLITAIPFSKIRQLILRNDLQVDFDHENTKFLINYMFDTSYGKLMCYVNGKMVFRLYNKISHSVTVVKASCYLKRLKRLGNLRGDAGLHYVDNMRLINEKSPLAIDSHKVSDFLAFYFAVEFARDENRNAPDGYKLHLLIDGLGIETQHFILDVDWSKVYPKQQRDNEWIENVISSIRQ